MAKIFNLKEEYLLTTPKFYHLLLFTHIASACLLKLQNVTKMLSIMLKTLVFDRNLPICYVGGENVLEHTTFAITRMTPKCTIPNFHTLLSDLELLRTDVHSLAKLNRHKLSNSHQRSVEQGFSTSFLNSCFSVRLICFPGSANLNQMNSYLAGLCRSWLIWISWFKPGKRFMLDLKYQLLKTGVYIH